MPRFFFNLLAEGRSVPDSEGLEQPTRAEAEKEALLTLADLSREACAGAREMQASVTVCDESGQPVFRAVLSLQSERLHARPGTIA